MIGYAIAGAAVAVVGFAAAVVLGGGRAAADADQADRRAFDAHLPTQDAAASGLFHIPPPEETDQ